MSSWGDIVSTIKALGGGAIALLVLYGGIWIKKVFDQKKRNEINEIDLSARKISLDNSAKPIDQLVSDSNASHGVNEVVGQTGNDDKKGK